MNKRTLITIIFSLLILLTYVNAETVTKTGTTSAKFLSIGVGSRANGIGNAFVAIANDASAMYWNPAGISQLDHVELVANYSQWIADMSYSYIGMVFPTSQYGSFGINTTYLNVGEMEVTTEQHPEGTGEIFHSGSYAIGISYAKNLTDRFSIGGNLKYINESISNCVADAVALDVGTLFITPFRDIRFGASISNFGSKMQMTGDDLLVQKDIDEQHHGNNESVSAYLATEKFDLPLLLRVGLSGDIEPSSLVKATWAIDAGHPNDNTEYVNFGLELSFFRNMINVRGGMNKLFLEEREENLSLGGGLNLNINNILINLDYAYQSFERFDLTHQYTLRLSF